MTFSTYNDHPIRASVSQLLAFQNRSEFAEPEVANNEQVAFARDKIFAIAELLRGLLDQTPATLASTTALGTIQGNLQAPINSLTEYLSNKNVAHISNAASHCEQHVLSYLWGLPQQVSDSGGHTLSALLTKQAELSTNTTRQLVSQRDDLAERINDLLVQVDTLATRLEAMKEDAAKERAQASAEVANLQKVFSEKEMERAGAFVLATTTFKQDFAQTKSTFSAAADTSLKDLADQQSKAARIVQVVGNIGVTGNYQQIANAEGSQANFWRWVTVAIFGTGISVAAATFIKFLDQPLSSENLWSVAIRLLYAIAITSPALYTARESARHRTNADRARQTELELASIGPFIELMPEDKKVAIRESLTASYFGKPISTLQRRNRNLYRFGRWYLSMEYGRIYHSNYGRCRHLYRDGDKFGTW